NGVPHTDPDDPPRRRANRAKGHGTWETDRPPVPGVVGRASGRVWFRVGRRSSSAELVDATVLPATGPGAMVDTDEWNGSNPLGRSDRGHATVNPNRGESRGMTTATASARCTATRWKGSGRGCGTSSGRSGV